MAALLLKSVCEKLHTQDKTLLSEATTSTSGLDGSALVNRLVGFCGGFAVFWPPATWEHYVPSFWRMLFSRRHLGRNIGSPRFCFCCHFHQNVLPHNSEESISGLRKSVSSRYSVTDARRYTEIYLTYCHRGMGGLNSAKALLSRLQLRKEGSQSSYGWAGAGCSTLRAWVTGGSQSCEKDSQKNHICFRMELSEAKATAQETWLIHWNGFSVLK